MSEQPESRPSALVMAAAAVFILALIVGFLIAAAWHAGTFSGHA
jgi:hypothetical protein